MLKLLCLVLISTILAAPGASCQTQPESGKEPGAAISRSAADLEQAFHQDKLWSGGDGAYSISLGSDKTLWLFGDSFIGSISSGSRKDNRMVHNAVGLQDQKTGKLSFYWLGQENPASYFSDGKDYWLWPGDGIFYDNKVYCFAKRVGLLPGKEDDPFGFVWKQDEILVIDNPLDEPDSWQCRHLALKCTNAAIHLGSACLRDADNLYVMGLKEKTHEAILARISLASMSQLAPDSFEFLVLNKNGKSSWCKKAALASSLFKQAAAEGSLLKTRDGFAFVYHRNGMGADIVARSSSRIDAPWSAEKVLYKIPESETKRGFCYAGKAHPEQAAPQGSLAVTYSVNPGNLEAHSKDPQAYFPHVIYLKDFEK